MSEAPAPSPDPPTHAEQARRCAEVLGELTEMGLTLARDLHARALGAEGAADAQAMALAFQRVSRSVRQSLALELKAGRELARDARDADDRIRQVRSAAKVERIIASARHGERVRSAMSRLIWTEAEGDEDEIEDLNEALTALLDDAAQEDDFLALPVEALVERFAEDMNLSAAARLAAAPKSPPPSPDLHPMGSEAWATGQAADSS